MPVRGNLGVQYVHSEQSSDGFAWNDGGSGGPPGGAVVPVHGGATYTDVLPSLNLVFDLKEDLLLRFGLGKTMARPRMDDMRAGADQPALTAIAQKTPDLGTVERKRRRQARTQALARKVGRPFAGEVLPETQLRRRRLDS